MLQGPHHKAVPGVIISDVLDCKKTLSLREPEGRSLRPKQGEFHLPDAAVVVAGTGDECSGARVKLLFFFTHFLSSGLPLKRQQ
jgi:hypothetical protein